MKQVYRVLAYAVAAGVVAQAMVIVYAVGSLNKWVDGGGVYNSAVADDATAYPGAGAFRIHETIGAYVVPSLVVLLILASLAARVRRGRLVGAIMFVLVGAQALLGYEASDQPAIGSLHGLFAFGLFGVAMYAGRLASPGHTAGGATDEPVAPPVASSA
jgi:hypothetical protein